MNIYGFTLEQLEEYFLSIDEKKFHAKQVYDWLYNKRINSFDEATNLSKNLIDKLKNNFTLEKLKIVEIQKDKDVRKYLFELKDGEHIEAVLMMHDFGRSVCVSSQVGCNMGCKFCESGRRKKVRNLETYEMVLQVLQIEEELGERISHVVVMGIGEPFDNYDNVINFFKILNESLGLAIGARHLTVSTCGIIPKIKEFAKLKLQVNLAISLHAPNNEIRNKIMPINKVYPIEDLMEALKEYYELTNRRLTFEYVMLEGVNDSVECAEELSKLVKGMNCYINLIPYNETNNLNLKRANIVQMMKFYDILKKNKITVTIRREFGSNISAACGQLRSKKEDV